MGSGGSPLGPKRKANLCGINAPAPSQWFTAAPLVLTCSMYSQGLGGVGCSSSRSTRATLRIHSQCLHSRSLSKLLGNACSTARAPLRAGLAWLCRWLPHSEGRPWLCHLPRPLDHMERPWGAASMFAFSQTSKWSRASSVWVNGAAPSSSVLRMWAAEGDHTKKWHMGLFHVSQRQGGSLDAVGAVLGFLETADFLLGHCGHWISWLLEYRIVFNES